MTGTLLGAVHAEGAAVARQEDGEAAQLKTLVATGSAEDCRHLPPGDIEVQREGQEGPQATAQGHPHADRVCERRPGQRRRAEDIKGDAEALIRAGPARTVLPTVGKSDLDVHEH